MGRGKGNQQQLGTIDPRDIIFGQGPNQEKLFIKKVRGLARQGDFEQIWTELAWSNSSVLKGKTSEEIARTELFDYLYSEMLESSGLPNKSSLSQTGWDGILREDFAGSLERLCQQKSDYVFFDRPALYSDDISYQNDIWENTDDFNLLPYGTPRNLFRQIVPFESNREADWDTLYNQVLPEIRLLNKEGKIHLKKTPIGRYLFSYLSLYYQEKHYSFENQNFIPLSETADLADRVWRERGVKSASFNKRNGSSLSRGNSAVVFQHQQRLKNKLLSDSRDVGNWSQEKIEASIDNSGRLCVCDQLLSLLNKDTSKKRLQPQRTLLNKNLEKASTATYLKRLNPLFDNPDDLNKLIDSKKSTINELKIEEVDKVISRIGSALWDENKAHPCPTEDEIAAEAAKAPKPIYELRNYCFFKPTTSLTEKAARQAIEEI